MRSNFRLIKKLEKIHYHAVVLKCFHKLLLNPFKTNAPILYPLKTTESLWFSGVFRGYEMRAMTRNGSRNVQIEPFKFHADNEASPLTQTTKLNFCFNKLEQI